MEVDIDNPQKGLTSILPSTSEVKNLKQPYLKLGTQNFVWKQTFPDLDLAGQISRGTVQTYYAYRQSFILCIRTIQFCQQYYIRAARPSRQFPQLSMCYLLYETQKFIEKLIILDNLEFHTFVLPLWYYYKSQWLCQCANLSHVTFKYYFRTHGCNKTDQNSQYSTRVEGDLPI